MQIEAYFITPTSTIIAVETFHIEKIIENPQMFGYTLQKIKSIYYKYGERLPVEGNARLQILADLLKVGWIRVRYKPREDSFTLQVWSINATVKRQLKKWAKHVTKDPESVPVYTGYELSEINEGGKIANGILKNLM